MKLRVPKPPEWVTILLLFLLPVAISRIVWTFEELLSEFTVLLGVVLFTGTAWVVSAFPQAMSKWTSYLAFLGGLTTYFIAPKSIDVEKFYELTVQIVPVLFLALGLEQRAFRSIPSKEPSLRGVRFMFFIGWPALALALAGAESLRTIATGNPERGTFDLVAGALVAAAISLTLTAMVGPYHPDQSTAPESPDSELANSDNR